VFSSLDVFYSSSGNIRHIPFSSSIRLLVFVSCSEYRLTRRGPIAAKPCSYGCCNFFALLFFFITWIVASIYLGVAVGIADSCQEPYVLGHRSAVRWLSSDDVSIVDYYATCRGVNPLQAKADLATGYLNDAHNSVVQLRAYATFKKPSLLPTVNEMDNNVKVRLLFFAGSSSIHYFTFCLTCAHLY
jgi:hypothetical protein